MKIFLTTLIFSFTCLFVNAQQDRFIYLQTQNKQPFFVKLNGKVYNSYPLGYLIIPKLDDGVYSLSIGFPDGSDEQEFSCSINKKDIGFIIKNNGEKQWQLLNVQTNNVIVPGNVITKPVIGYEKETDPFSTMLASAVHDSTILRKDVAKQIVVEKPAEQIKKDTANSLASNNVGISTNALADSANKELAKETAEKSKELNQKDTIQSTAAIIKVDIPKQDSLRNDSVKTDIAKETFPPVSNEVKQKDSSQIVSNSDVAVSQPDSVKTDIAKETIAQRSDEIKDTAQATLKSDVAIVKLKKKRKKNDASTTIEKNAEKEKPVIQSTVFIDDVATGETVKKKRGKKNTNAALIDSTVTQKDIAKEIVSEKTIETPKDTTQTITSNSDIAVTKSKKKRAKKVDSTLQDSTAVAKELVKETIPEKVNKVNDAVQSSATNTDVALVRSVIKRKSKKSSKEGLFMLYVDDNGESKDTISVLIPSEKKAKEKKIGEPVFSSTIIDDKPKEVVSDRNKADYKVTKQEKEIIKEANKEPVFISTMINSDCKSVATDDDFLRIRKKMVAENNDEDMVKAARKFFKMKCFTTEQIKNLSVLFLKDESKFMFFEAAYPFASDSDQYHNLEKQLTDNNYITRFRAMIHK